LNKIYLKKINYLIKVIIYLIIKNEQNP